MMMMHSLIVTTGCGTPLWWGGGKGDVNSEYINIEDVEGDKEDEEDEEDASLSLAFIV